MRHIGDWLDHPDRLDLGLGSYARERDDAMTEGYEATLSVGQLRTHPKRLSLLRAVQSDPDLTATYFDVVAGAKPVSELYAPRVLALL